MSHDGEDRASGTPPPCYQRPAWWLRIAAAAIAVAWLLYTLQADSSMPPVMAIVLMAAIVVAVVASHFLDRPASRARKAAMRDGG